MDEPVENKPLPKNIVIEDPPEFDEKHAKHEVTILRLYIAKCVLVGIGILILISLGLLSNLGGDEMREVLSNVFSSLFSIAALTIGFIAGSSIDRK